jgi:hypothetical protein
LIITDTDLTGRRKTTHENSQTGKNTLELLTFAANISTSGLNLFHEILTVVLSPTPFAYDSNTFPVV